MKIPLIDLQTQYKSLNREINQAFIKLCQSSQFIKGSYLEAFEEEFADYIGTKYCVGVASGTDALYLSLKSLNIGKGDEVILPSFTFMATAYAIIYAGAKPVFVDIDPSSFNLDTSQIEKKLTKKTRAIIPVHLYGQPADMYKVLKIARKNSLYVLEDAAQAHGATYDDKKVGNFGMLSAFSFYPGKNLGAFGDAGAIVTNSLSLAKRLKKLREYGATSKYFFDEIGINSRLDSLQAAILSIKLKRLDEWNYRRQKAALIYDTLIKEIPFIEIPKKDSNSSHVYHLYVIKVPYRNILLKHLNSLGIQALIHYPLPLHLQKSLKFLGYKKGDFPIAEQLSKRVLTLPIYPEITFKQQDYIVKSIKSFFKYEN